MEPCCENLENRSEPEVDPERPDIVVTRCLVCGRRHFELTVDPGELGIKFGNE